MKAFNIKHFIALLIACALVGCGRNDSKANLDMTKLETAFASAGPDIKSVVDKSVADAKSANYRGAFDDLVPLLKNQNLTTEQVDSLRETMHQLSLLFPPPNPSMSIPK
jgi:hypothetical protein